MKEKVYYSHARVLEDEAHRGSKPDKDAPRVGTKHLSVHTGGVRDKAVAAIHPRIRLGVDPEQFSRFIADLATYHDLGKYLPDFQKYLLNDKPFFARLKRHAAFGAQAIYNAWQESDKELAMLAWVLVLKHHTNLPNWRRLEGWYNECFENQLQFRDQVKSLKSTLNEVQTDSGVDNLENLLHWPTEDILLALYSWSRDNGDIRRYYLVNYAFSLLIEADKLDATDTSQYLRKAVAKALVDDFLKEKTTEDTTQNNQRHNARMEVISHLDAPDILERRLFTLTAPTGIGKTLTSLDFALRLKSLIREKEGHEPQIIYALPFINIIEQSISVYEKVLNGNAHLLAHYQFADIFRKDEKNPEEREDKEQFIREQQMALDTWQSDVVITSFVQLLQTLIGNRNRLLKKFNHFAGSILILDEVQNMSLKHLPLVGATFYYLAHLLDARVILMTATKPKIFELAEQEILSKRGVKLEGLHQPLELLSNHERYFRELKRTKLIPHLDEMESTEDWADFIVEKRETGKSALIVCNKVQRSIDLYALLQKKIGNANLYYLSTNLLPVHREEVRNSVAEALEAHREGEGPAPILVSTQCIEAGVDLDFDMGFRDLGPLDSIIQVAGRINRNDSPGKEHAPVHIVNMGDSNRIYGKITQQQATKALQAGMEVHGPEIEEAHYLDMVTTYFTGISEASAFNESRDIFKAMECLQYEPINDEPSVSSFKVIEDIGKTISVFIEADEKANEALKAFYDMLSGDLGREEFNAKHKRTFHQHTLAVPDYLSKAKELIQMSSLYEKTEGFYVVPAEEVNDFYNNTTGFNRDKAKEETAMML
ncbi:CRISPR-associated helicase Cas3' [Roseivirga sp. BDSF3-8]|uniref:CRISPR-associated helicase Cas3' n=1 Tax=Roseivirga sp. BDSF3-8 TaxID=3241598 RepID=UPI003531C668